jgi:phosphoribosylanthranilate isomerase
MDRMTRVKVCGITRLEDAKRAVDAGAWAIGMIFVPDTPRAIEIGPAREIGRALQRQVQVTGVFVNAAIDEVVAVADACALTMIQLHGDEGPAYCREVARRTGAKVMKAVRAKDATAVRHLSSYREVDLHLLDSYVDGRLGGTGETFPWELARHHVGSVPFVLSGGLTPDNVGEAITQVHPYAVDTASGTEASPGVKDPAKLTAFFRAVEHASQRAA